MKATIVGAESVGSVAAACLAEMSKHVGCHLEVPRKSEMRQRGEKPIHEPGHQALREGTLWLHVVDHQSAALDSADALLIATDWKEVRTPDVGHSLATLNRPLILDGRNLSEPALMREFGIDHVGVGRGAAPTET